MYKKFTMSELESLHMTKGELFQPLRDDGHTFDYALPQRWLDDLAAFCKRMNLTVTYHLILSTTVWVYPEDEPLTMCTEAEWAINMFTAALENGWEQPKGAQQ